MQINSETQLNMVIGHPLIHSKSPQLHNIIYSKYHINAQLLAFSNPILAPLIQSIKNLNVGLTAVTMPFKEKVLSYLDECSDEVHILKAANTIIQKQGKLIGYNTDIAGIAYTFRHIALVQKKILILGAGGAARAAGFFLKNQKAALYWHNRTLSHLHPITQIFGGHIVENLEMNQMNFDIIINTTPVGLYPHCEQTPLPDFKFHAQQIVFDMIYYPVETFFLKRAKNAGAKTLSGLSMFIGQGLRQIELWLGHALPQTSLYEEIQIALSE